MILNSMTSAAARVGIVGTGFIATGLVRALQHAPDLRVSRILTRRPLAEIRHLPSDRLTHSLSETVDTCDVLVECCGDVGHGYAAAEAALAAGRPVVTMASELHVTVGSDLCDRGVFTEAEGDQPGCLAALHEEAVSMGFRPLVYGNMKGFLNLAPSEDEMQYWARRNGLTLNRVTSFTDGTKLQIEQAFVANGLGASLLRRGMVGLRDELLETAGPSLARQAKAVHSPVSDYLLGSHLPPGVFVVAEHPTEPPEILRYFKLGEGPYYVLLRSFHLCHLEICRTIRRVMAGGPVLLNNSAAPRITVAAVAKKELAAGTSIAAGIGGFEVRGEAVDLADEPDSVPIGLLSAARVTRSVHEGETLHWDAVELPDSPALRAWRRIRDRVLAAAR